MGSATGGRGRTRVHRGQGGVRAVAAFTSTRLRTDAPLSGRQAGKWANTWGEAHQHGTAARQSSARLRQAGNSASGLALTVGLI